MSGICPLFVDPGPITDYITSIKNKQLFSYGID
jgi:hypothetical protein